MIRRLANFSTLPSIASSSSLASRTASSFSVPSSHIPSCRPILAGRGRFKPTRGGSISARISAARQNRTSDSQKTELGASEASVKIGRGRNKRRLSAYTVEIPISSPYTPTVKEGTVAESLHMGLTPAHMPLPIPLGTEHYFGERGSLVNPVPSPSEWHSSSLGPFDPSIRSTNTLHGDVKAMVKANSEVFDGHRSALNDHLHVMYALARPGRSHHLAEGKEYNAEFFDSDLPSLTSTLNTAVNEAGARNALAAETEWNEIFAKFSGTSSSPAQPESEQLTVSEEEKSAVNDAVSDLNVLLQGLAVEESALLAGRTKKGSKMIAVVGEDGSEEWIRMDSTRRKRKKKINKHKFKKRRKVSVTIVLHLRQSR